MPKRTGERFSGAGACRKDWKLAQRMACPLGEIGPEEREPTLGT